ncbi:MAG: hypothetical protein Q8P83_02080 [bacterium]|nr:hypothetical protein [bacterium]
MTVTVKKVLGVLSGIVAAALIFSSLIIPTSVETIQNLGYFGFFIASYLGLFAYVALPFLVQTLNPVLLILIGAFGFTIDEFFAWYAGSTSKELKHNKEWHRKIQAFVEKRGLLGIFILGLLPLHGVIYTVSGFAAGHYSIPFWKFFLANFTGKLIRTTVIVISLLKFF